MRYYESMMLTNHFSAAFIRNYCLLVFVCFIVILTLDWIPSGIINKQSVCSCRRFIAIKKRWNVGIILIED